MLKYREWTKSVVDEERDLLKRQINEAQQQITDVDVDEDYAPSICEMFSSLGEDLHETQSGVSEDNVKRDQVEVLRHVTNVGESNVEFADEDEHLDYGAEFDSDGSEEL